MADRTVSVELQARVGQYKTEVEDAKVKTEGLDRTVSATSRDLDKLERDSAKAAATMKLLGLEAGSTSRELEHTGTAAVGVLDRIDAKLATSRAQVKAFAEEFNKTGSLDAFRLWQQATTDTRALEKLRKSLTQSFGTIGQDAGTAVSSGFLDQLKATLPTSITEALTNPYILGAILAAAPTVGVLIGGAVLTGIGLAGIGTGIVGQIHDPAIVAALQQLKNDVSRALDASTIGFAAPLGRGVEILDAALVRLLATIGPGLQALSGTVVPLAEGVAGMADALGPGLNHVLEESAPLVTQLAAQLPQLGAALGDLLNTIADNSAEAKDGLVALLNIVTALLEFLAWDVEVLSKLWDAAKATTLTLGLLAGAGDKSSKSIKDTGDAASNATAPVEDLAQQYLQLQRDIDAANRSFEESVRQMIDAENAAINYQQSIDDLSQSVKENGRSLDINTQAGRNNRRAIDELIGTIEANYEANIKAGVGADQASLAFEQQIQALKDQLTQLGFSKQAIDEYIKKLEAMRYAAISANNAINDTGLGHTHHDSYAQGGFRAAATGMFIPPSDPGTTLVGEPQTGGEYLIPARGIPGARAYDLLSDAARGYGLDVGHAWRGATGSSGGGPSTLQLAATFVLPSGEVVHKQLITYALNTGRAPSSLFPTSSR